MSPSLLFLLLLLSDKSVFLAASALCSHAFSCFSSLLQTKLQYIAPCVHPRKRAAETVDRGRLRSRQQSHGGVRKGRNLGTGFAISKGILGSSSVFSLWLSYRKTMHARIMEMWITPAEMTEKASRGQTPPGERRLHDLGRLKPLPLLSACLVNAGL